MRRWGRHWLDTPWRFYVYALTEPSGEIRYVGKGSGSRLVQQRRRYKLGGYEVARFLREKDAYAFERALISEVSPALNQHPGGNGSTVDPIPVPKYPKWFVNQRRVQAEAMQRLGPRRFCAQFLLDRIDAIAVYTDSKVDEIRPPLQAVLDGPWC